MHKILPFPAMRRDLINSRLTYLSLSRLIEANRASQAQNLVLSVVLLMTHLLLLRQTQIRHTQ